MTDKFSSQPDDDLAERARWMWPIQLSWCQYYPAENGYERFATIRDAAHFLSIMHGWDHVDLQAWYKDEPNGGFVDRVGAPAIEQPVIKLDNLTEEAGFNESERDFRNGVLEERGTPVRTNAPEGTYYRVDAKIRKHLAVSRCNGTWGVDWQCSVRDTEPFDNIVPDNSNNAGQGYLQHGQGGYQPTEYTGTAYSGSQYSGY